MAHKNPENFRFFPEKDEIGMGTMVFLTESDQPLWIRERGVLTIPRGVRPDGFNLMLTIPAEARIVVAQKNVAQEQGEYRRNFLSTERNGQIILSTQEPIEVKRHGKNVWTHWHADTPNRVDCWRLRPDATLDLFQIGVITHDDGRTFRLLGEWRWRGKLFRDNKELVAKPADPVWGPFTDSRRSIFQDEDFRRLLKDTNISVWNGTAEELNPPLESAPPGYARVQWYVPFAGQTGQGIAILPDGNPAWFHGTNLPVRPDEDGIRRVRRGNLLHFNGLQKRWGKKQQGPPKILQIHEVTRAT